ncbi:hypothetical protein ACKKBG_A04180 [Auxenochlorella protothecoides x Auxenochlorella symbiontica]|uniref:Ubiquitin-like-conjugating enzyme ATG10 n=2 Tax=Auxenochlorella protothecoides TaxID=3075 RepID=A0A1D1ZXY4_AUXPR
MLDPVEFKLGAQELARAWAEVCPGGPLWEWVPQMTAFASSKGGGYLQLARVPVRGEGGSVAFFTYHILYSPSYRVPVLHFTAHDSAGATIHGLDILPHLPGPADGDASPLDSVLSQEDHPFLDEPFFQVHPCASQDTLALMLRGARGIPQGTSQLLRYMIAWLSVAAQPVGLAVPLSLHLQTQPGP